MRVLSEADVARLIEPRDAIETAAIAFGLQSDRSVAAPVRGTLAREEPKAGCLLLAGAWGAEHLAIKSNLHAYPGGTESPRLWGSLLTLWDWHRAAPRALISARAFNDHRTAAGFAVGAQVLAPTAARTFAIFGAGKSAPMTARYLKAVRPSLKRLYLQGRSLERIAALHDLLTAMPEFFDVQLIAGASAGEAVSQAEIIATVTTSDTPVFPGEAVRPGACIILGGANRPTAREADDALMRRADVYCDAREGALDKAGDLRLALASGALAPARTRGEIGSHLDGPLPLSPGSDVFVFKSMGLPIQDVVLAERIVSRAEALSVGQIVDLEGGTA
jgi:ornithine cyclodeaminase